MERKALCMRNRPSVRSALDSSGAPHCHRTVLMLTKPRLYHAKLRSSWNPTRGLAHGATVTRVISPICAGGGRPGKTGSGGREMR